VAKQKKPREGREPRYIKHYIRDYLDVYRDAIPPSIIVMLLDRLAALDGVYKVELTPRRTTQGPSAKTETEQIPEIEIDIDKMLERGENAADNSESTR
jgi:hypothetical protein